MRPGLIALGACILAVGGVYAARWAGMRHAPGAGDGDIPSWAHVAPAQVEAAKKAGVPVAFENSIGMRFVLIPAGTFTMGSPVTEAGRWDEETPHPVTLTKPYYLGVTEVTNGQYRRFEPNHDSRELARQIVNGEEQPVVDVSWKDAVAFAAWLGGHDRTHRYRLPTEAEWERACRAGSATAFWFGDDESKEGEYEWSGIKKTGRRSHPVGTLRPNAWGLYDMHGNVMEWCQDWMGEYPRGAVVDPSGLPGPDKRAWRVFRGGDWGGGRQSRSAYRRGLGVDFRAISLGFRLAADVAAQAPPPPALGNAPPPPPAPAPKPGEPALPVAPPPQEGQVPSWAKVAPEQLEAATKAGVPVAFENSIGMRFVLIPAGTFTMGSPATEEGHEDDESPQHPVTLSKPYHLAITEVTNGQYRRFQAGHDSGGGRNGDDQPVVQVSWDGATAFVAWLNAQDRDRTYRLPTEAEWERACRAGTTTRYGSGDAEADLARVGWYDANSGDHPHVVGEKPGSPWGLYDMHGNVVEWCEDWYGEYPSGTVRDPTGASDSGRRVTRGGSWGNTARNARSAFRAGLGPRFRFGFLGFRVAASVPSGAPAR